MNLILSNFIKKNMSWLYYPILICSSTPYPGIYLCYTVLSYIIGLLIPLSWYLLLPYLSYALGWSDLVLFTIWVHAVAVDTKSNSQKVLSFAARAPHAIRVNVFSFKNHRDLKICIFFIYFFYFIEQNRRFEKRIFCILF